MTELRVHLQGQDARLGEVPARDIARLVIAVEDALRRAATVVLGSPKVTTGRYGDTIEQAARLRLRAIEEGSVVPVLELRQAEAEQSLPTQDATLADVALSRLLDAADVAASPDPYLASALLSVADEVRLGDRYDAVTFDVRSGRSGPPRRVRIDGQRRGVLRAYVDTLAARRPERADAVAGTLVEADFERGTARLRTPTDQAVIVDFAVDLADVIHEALRSQTTLRGRVTYDPLTHIASRVELEALEHGEQLTMGLDPRAFWQVRSFDELATIQGTRAPVRASELYDPDASEDERDALMAAILESQ